MDGLSVLFSNGLVYFGNEQSIENEKQFTDNNPCECRYCWGRYQYQPPRLTVFRPLAAGYLNLPGSYPVSKLEYREDNDKFILLSHPAGETVIQKKRLFINPERSWLVKRRKKLPAQNRP